MFGNNCPHEILKKVFEKQSKQNFDLALIEEEVQKIKDQVAALDKETKTKLLLQGIQHLDLTSLGPDDTSEKIKNLCLKAAIPIELKDPAQGPIRTAAVCVYPTKVKDAINTFKKHNITGIKIASVGGGFPSGKISIDEKVQEIEGAVEAGADEIDIVINREFVSKNEWDQILEQLKQMRKACGNAHMKTILSTGELGGMENVYLVSQIAMSAGSDFIKTSTGKELVNATLPVGIVMCRAIKEYYDENHKKIGFKPAGGIKTAEDVLNWIILIKTQLGEEWLTPDLFRIGASSVLDEIVKTYNSLIS